MARIPTGKPAGRPKGDEHPHRREARRRLIELYPDWHPLVQMAALAQDETATEELKFQACREVCSYLMPKLKAIEHTGADGAALTVILSQADADL